MSSFKWSRTLAERNIKRIDDQGVVYVISDLHLGDGSSSDIFMSKDKHLLRFLRQVRDEGASIIVAGDAVDFSQAWFLENILKAHGRVFGAFSELAQKGRLFYILGNHDHDMRFFSEVLRIPVVHGVEIGEHTLVLHGYEYDPVIGEDLDKAEWRTRMHHLFERVLNTWLRLPLEHFYTRWNRATFWLFHKLIHYKLWQANLIDSIAGDDSRTRAAEAELNYWTRCQMGDPGALFHPAAEAIRDSEYETLICGHSHLPGVVDVGEGKRYANSGHWTFNSSTYLRVEGSEIICRDFLTGKIYDDRLYRPIVGGELEGVHFFDWWNANYLGWFRWRKGEERVAQAWTPQLTGDDDPNRKAS